MQLTRNMYNTKMTCQKVHRLPPLITCPRFAILSTICPSAVSERGVTDLSKPDLCDCYRVIVIMGYYSNAHNISNILTERMLFQVSVLCA